ncbi:hypothetical protein WA158_007919 [Blastocystis sp. Blastoise]
MSQVNIIPAESSGEWLFQHSLTCTKQLGKCSVPGCGIAQRLIQFVCGTTNECNQDSNGSLKRSKSDSNTSKKRKQSISLPTSSFIPYPPSIGDFIEYPVQYNIHFSETSNGSNNSILSHLKNEDIESYLAFLKLRPLQTMYGPLIQSLIQNKDNRDIFNKPVDPVRYNLPTYFTIVKHPMDLGTIRDKLASGFYSNSFEIESDIELVFKNAMLFNPKENSVHIAAVKLLRFYHSELEKLHTKMEQMFIQHDNHYCTSCRGYPCKLCQEKCLKYSPLVIVCDGPCHQKILRNATYYLIRGMSGKWCSKCSNKMLSGCSKEERKHLLIKKKNDASIPESWIQCSICHDYMHSTCGLVHPRQNPQHYICPICIMKIPNREIYPWEGSSILPDAPITLFLKQRIDDRVATEYLKNQQEIHHIDISNPAVIESYQKDIKAIQDTLVIKMLSNIKTTCKVKECLAPLYTGSLHTSLEIPYTSKCIALFQRKNGLDIILFLLYVYEFGCDSSIPISNQRTIYISYLDSVHYMTPRFLRTSLYHEIIQGYLVYAKQQGYTRTHIWACPPSRGDDYIFSHHPRDQRTPNASRLIEWYRKMLADGKDTKCILYVKCQLDCLIEANSYGDGNTDIMNIPSAPVFSLEEDPSTNNDASSVLPSSLLKRNGSIHSEYSEIEIENPNNCELTDSTSLISPHHSSTLYSTLVANASPSSTTTATTNTSLQYDDTSSVSTTNSTSPISSAPNDFFDTLSSNSLSTPTPNPLNTSSSLLPLSHFQEHNTPLASSLPKGYLSPKERRLMKLIPYFEGDFWPYMGDSLLQEIYEDEAKGKFDYCKKNPIKSMGKSKMEQKEYEWNESITKLPSELIRRFCKSMLENPGRFLVVYMHPYCSYCGDVIENEQCYQCEQCKDSERPFFLCTTCAKLNVPHNHAHPLALLRVSSLNNCVDENPVISCKYLDKRQDFLHFCQGNFFQFDTLRHALLSTSMLLKFIKEHPKDSFLELCDGCECTLYEKKYCCQLCKNYKLCEDCLLRDGGLHVRNHELFSSLASNNS